MASAGGTAGQWDGFERSGHKSAMSKPNRFGTLGTQRFYRDECAEVKNPLQLNNNDKHRSPIKINVSQH